MSSYNSQNTLVIIPAKDEAGSIGTVIKEVKLNGWHNILVVNDLSLDETAAIARKNGAIVMDLPIHLGAWGAIQAGMRYALEKKYDACVTLDGDGQHEGRYISKLVDKLEESQIVTGSASERGIAYKGIIWRILRLVSGISLSDITSGFRAYTGDVIKNRSPSLDILKKKDLKPFFLQLTAWFFHQQKEQKHLESFSWKP